MRVKALLLIISFFTISFSAISQQRQAEQDALAKKPFLRKHLTENQSYTKRPGSATQTYKASEDTPNFTGVSLVGGTGRNSIFKSIEGVDGNIYSFGYYHKTMTIEDQTIESDSITTYFMAKYNSSGNLLQLKNIMTFQSNIDFRLEDIQQFDGGFIWIGNANADLLINEQSYAINERRAFVFKTDLTGATSWYNDFATSRFPEGRGQVYPSDVSADSIYISLHNNSITTLNNVGEEVDTYTLNEIYGGISVILVNGNSLVFGGYFDNYLSVGNLSVNETNQYQASFLASIAIDNKNVEFLLENSVPETESGDSYPLQLLGDENQNIYLYGNSRGAISWENGVIDQGYANSKFLSKFSSDGTISNGTRFFNSYSPSYVTYANGKIFTKFLIQISEYDFSIPFDNENLIVIDTDLNYLNSFVLDFNSQFEKSISKFNAFSSDKVAISGSIDYNSNFSVFDTNSGTFTMQKRTSELSGDFAITGLIKDAPNQSYIAGNKRGYINVFDQDLRDTSSAIISSVKDGSTEWISKIYNGYLNFDYGHSLVKTENKLALMGTAEDGFSINEQSINLTGKFISQFNIDGSLDWTKVIDVVNINSLGFDEEGNIYASGRMFRDVTIDGQTFPMQGAVDIFILKLTSNGDLVWFKNYGNSDILTFYASNLVVNNGQIYFSVESSLSTTATLTIEGTTVNLGSSQYGNNLMMSFTTDGELKWAKSHGASDIEGNQNSYWGTGMTAAKNGFYMAGTFGTSNLFDEIILKGNNTYNHFIAKYDSLGGTEWVKAIQLETFSFNYAEIGTDENDNVYIQGGLRDNISIDSAITLSSNGGTDIYMAKFLANGDLGWAKKIDVGYSFTKVMEVLDNNSVYLGTEINGIYEADNFTGQAYFGNSLITSICAVPSMPNIAVGLTEVNQGDTTSYTTETLNTMDTEWSLSPTNAGEINVITNDSIRINWSDSFEGNAELTYTLSNVCGSSSSSPLNIVVNANPITATENELNSKLSIYPNPANNSIHLSIKDDLKIKGVSIVSLGGQKLIESKKISNNMIDVSSLKSGMYIINIESNLGVINYKFVKK